MIILGKSAKLLQIESIEQISMPVKDIERAIEFYRDRLELDFLFHTNNMAFFACGGITVMLAVPERAEFDHPGGSVLYLKVNSIEESYQLLKERNVVFRGKPHIVHKTDSMEKWMVFFEDVDHNVLALTSDVLL